MNCKACNRVTSSRIKLVTEQGTTAVYLCEDCISHVKTLIDIAVEAKRREEARYVK